MSSSGAGGISINGAELEASSTVGIKGESVPLEFGGDDSGGNRGVQDSC